MRRFIVFLVSAALGMVSPVAMAAEARIVVDGSTTVGPIAKAFAEYYMSKHPDVNITVSESGSGNGAKSLVNGTCDVAAMSRFMKDNEFQAAVAKGVMPVAHVVAVDGLAMIVHPSNRVKDLSLEQLRDIYEGKIKNWSEVGGPSLPIVKIGRDTNSGTYETFESLVMQGARVSGDAETSAATARVRPGCRARRRPSATWGWALSTARSSRWRSTGSRRTARRSPRARTRSPGRCSCSPTAIPSWARPCTVS